MVNELDWLTLLFTQMGNCGDGPSAPRVETVLEDSRPSSSRPSKGSRRPLEATTTMKLHSKLRWDKPEEELRGTMKDLGVSMDEALLAQDPKTGNFALHVCAQNGHAGLLKLLLCEQANPNVQNFKGQTPLHMTVEFEFYFLSVALLASGADAALVNAEGHEALTGIDGEKWGASAWDTPVSILRAAGDCAEELELAFSRLEAAESGSLDKASLAQAGMAKRRTCTVHWDVPRFRALMRTL